MKLSMKFIVAFFIYFSLSSHSPAVSGTIDNATLLPETSRVLLGSSSQITFSALNNKAFVLKSYKVIFQYDSGLTVMGLSTTPTAATAVIDTRKRQIKLTWTNVPINMDLTASFSASSSKSGVYNIKPSSINYIDNNRNIFTGTCNTAIVMVRTEFVPPSAPRVIWSIIGDGFIDIKGIAPQEPDLAGFNIYRRAANTDYSNIAYQPGSLSYRDINVQDRQTYFYAVTAVDTSGNESQYSTETALTYYQNLGVKSLDFKATAGAVGDLNGDGRPDIALGLPYPYDKKADNGKVGIFLGGSTSQGPDIKLVGEPSGVSFGTSLAMADLNNDGYDDLIVGDPDYDVEITSGGLVGTAYEAGKVYVFKGGSVFNATPALTLQGGFAYDCYGGGYYLLVSERLGDTMAPAGDVNGDGYQDVVLGLPMAGRGRRGRVDFLLGGPNIVNNTISVQGPVCDGQMGSSLAPAGDVNGDGYDDIIAGALPDAWDPPPGKAYLIYGGQGTLTTSVTFYQNSPSYGKSVTGLDINGDGFSDIAVASKDCVYVYYGGPALDNQDDVIFHNNSGNAITTIGDVNGDGYEDLVSGGPILYFGGGENAAEYIMNNKDVLGPVDIDNNGSNEIMTKDINGYVEICSLASILSLPEITISSPRDHETTLYQGINLNGIVTGAVRRLLVSGQETQVQADGKFSAQISLQEGSNVIEIIAVTNDDRISKRTLNITYTQPSPLGLVISSPADGAVFNSSPINVTGTISDPSATVKVNGITAPVSGNSYRAGIDLAEGSNTITVDASDSYGQTASFSITVNLITKGTITGTVTDSETGLPLSGVTVKILDSLNTNHTTSTDSSGVYTLSDVSQGGFTAAYSKTGYTKKTISGTLTAGNTQTLNVQLVQIPLLNLNITSPADGAAFNSSPIMVSGNVTNNANVTVNGVQATVSNGIFTATISLNEGQNTITATATDQYNQTATDNIDVNLVYLTPTVSISAAPASLMLGEQATLSWTSANADAAIIDQGIGSVGLDGSTTVSPSETTTYTITATGPGGTAISSVTVSVTYPEPTASISAAPSSIMPGESATLSWSSTNADSASIDQGIGTVSLSGSIVVSPTATTTYTITVTRGGETVVDFVTVVVIQPVEVFITAEPQSIPPGGQAVLTWVSTGAETCIIDSGIGQVDTSGSMTVTSAETTTYTVTATGPGGTSAASVTISVSYPLPTISFSANPQVIVTNQSATLTWTTTNATEVLISDIGAVSGNGTVLVTPDRMKTYILTATGPGGTATAVAKVFVYKGVQYDYGDPTPAEQAHLEKINRARLNPEQEASRLGIDLNEGLPPGTISSIPVQPLVFNAKLIQASQLHTQDMISQQYWAHNSLDGLTPEDRIYNTGYAYSHTGENLHLLAGMSPLDETESVLKAHDDLFIDAGVPGRTHRLNILAGRFKEVGVGVAGGPYLNFDYSYMTTCDFASSSIQPHAFLLGVIYDDSNQDSLYTAGEGIKDVEIRIEGTQYATVSATAGGYGIPLPPGDYTVTAILPNGLGASRQIRIIDQNIKLDFIISDFSAPPSADFRTDNKIILMGASATLSWIVSDADTITIDNEIGPVSPVGSLVLTPGTTTSYTLTAKGSGGTRVKTITIYVVNPTSLPMAEFTATPLSITSGRSSVLSWHVSDADTVSIDNGIGSVDPKGSVVIKPGSTTTYCLNASGPGGSVSAAVTVTVSYPLPTASFNASPTLINAGYSTTLTWHTAGADAISIIPDVGVVGPSGSFTISPGLTTVYILTAIGPGGTKSVEAQVTVSHQAPRINFSAAQDTIINGQEGFLSWNVTGADTVTINNGIGAVEDTGSTLVAPNITTTYTLSATGPGGAATQDAIITVIEPTAPPVVAFYTSPEVVLSGDTSTLSWNVVNAATISIDNNIGSVGENGSVPVAPTETTTYTLTATGPGGVTTKSVTINISRISITILSPTPGAVITRPDVMVKGTFSNAGGLETGITVNGVLAVVYGNQFAANHVPLQEGVTTITVTATDTSGDTNTAEIHVTIEESSGYIRLTASDESDIAPFEAMLRVDGSFIFTANKPSFTGPGPVEFLEAPEENEFIVRMTEEGIYFFTAQVMDNEGNTYADPIEIVVVNGVWLDALLKAKWNGMKTALITGDIEGGLSYHTEGSKNRYRNTLSFLAAELPSLVSQMQDIELIYFRERTAKYRINRIHDIDGESINITYYIYFIKDHNGLWRIDQY